MSRNQGGGPAAAPVTQAITCRVEIDPHTRFTTNVRFEGSLSRDVVAAALVEMTHAIVSTHRRLLGLGEPVIENVRIS